MNIFQTIYNNTKIRCILAVCVCLWIAVMVQVVVTIAFEKEADITEAFEVEDNINIRKCSVEGTACLNLDRQSFDNIAVFLLEEITADIMENNNSKSIIPDNKNLITYSEENGRCYKIECNTKSVDYYATVSWSDKTNQAYFHCKAGIKDTVDRMENVYNILKDNFNQGKKEGYIDDEIIYTSVEADKSGIMDENECVQYTDRMFGRISAESVADGGSGFYTVYGYTPRIYDNIQRNGDKINIQASFSYDENNDVTIISIGSPVLNCDY